VRADRRDPDAGVAAIIRPVAGAIAVVMRARDLLLVQRRNPPDAGLWGYPGGKIESGETIMDAAVRELREETGVLGRARRLLTPFDVLRYDAGGELTGHFILLPVLCDWVSGTPAAASDALAADWFSIARLEKSPQILSEHVLALANHAIDLSANRLN
jgi:ADP-ribose pyrophosphatase YjhB (NUDIX family)